MDEAYTVMEFGELKRDPMRAWADQDAARPPARSDGEPAQVRFRRKERENDAENDNAEKLRECYDKAMSVLVFTASVEAKEKARAWLVAAERAAEAGGYTKVALDAAAMAARALADADADVVPHDDDVPAMKKRILDVLITRAALLARDARDVTRLTSCLTLLNVVVDNDKDDVPVDSSHAAELLRALGITSSSSSSTPITSARELRVAVLGAVLGGGAGSPPPPPMFWFIQHNQAQPAEHRIAALVREASFTAITSGERHDVVGDVLSRMETHIRRGEDLLQSGEHHRAAQSFRSAFMVFANDVGMFSPLENLVKVGGMLALDCAATRDAAALALLGEAKSLAAGKAVGAAVLLLTMSLALPHEATRAELVGEAHVLRGELLLHELGLPDFAAFDVDRAKEVDPNKARGGRRAQLALDVAEWRSRSEGGADGGERYQRLLSLMKRPATSGDWGFVAVNVSAGMVDAWLLNVEESLKVKLGVTERRGWRWDEVPSVEPETDSISLDYVLVLSLIHI